MLDSLTPMTLSPQTSKRKLSRKPSFLLALLCLVCTACSTTAQNSKIIFEDQRGTVSLQTMPDQSMQATHPISMEPALIAQILTGIEVQSQERGLQGLFAGHSTPVPAFSDDQIQFLAPLLAEALRTAAPDQRVAYRLHTTLEGSMLESSTTETTAGSLYAYGRQLCVILSQYRYSPTRTNMKLSDSAYKARRPDSSGLQDSIVLFTPRAAQRSDSIDPPGGLQTTDRFLAIDYQLLQHAPAAATAGKTAPISGSSAGAGTSGASAQSTEALAQEVEALKKEMQSLKQQQLENQTTRPDSPKQKTPPPAKP
jgi:hypothetical protein